MLQVAGAERCRARRRSLRNTGWRRCAGTSARRSPEPACRCASMDGRPIVRRASICIGAGARCRSACRRCATIRIARARNSHGSRMPPIRACTPLELRSRRGCRRALHRQRRAACGRHPARAGRQQPDRNGRGVHARRLRCLRCAHDRYLEPAACAWGDFTDWWPAAGSPTATCWAPARGGRSRYCSTRGRARNSPAFFARDATFTLGVCNGCQMLAALKELIPGRAAWPRFVRNRSEQYEARLALVRVAPSQSVLLAGMQGSVLPIAVAHGEGQAEFDPDSSADETAARTPADTAVRRHPRPADASGIPSIRTAPPWGWPGCAAPTAA